MCLINQPESVYLHNNKKKTYRLISIYLASSPLGLSQINLVE